MVGQNIELRPVAPSAASPSSAVSPVSPASPQDQQGQRGQQGQQIQQDQSGQQDSNVTQTHSDTPNWAELDTNAAPQVAMSNAPEAMAPPGVDIEADPARRSSSDDKPTPIATPKPWYKKKTLLALICVIILAVIIIPVTIIKAEAAKRQGDAPNPTSSTVASSGTSDASSTTTATTRIPASASSVVPECNVEDFTTGVNWIGSSVPNWSFKMDMASDAVDCCELCYQDDGCNGWMYLPDEASAVPACNRILNHTGPNSSDDCPNGKPDIVFAKGSNTVESYGGGGPCAGRVRG